MVKPTSKALYGRVTTGVVSFIPNRGVVYTKSWCRLYQIVVWFVVSFIPNRGVVYTLCGVVYTLCGVVYTTKIPAMSR
jgi:hypothetical protein